MHAGAVSRNIGWNKNVQNGAFLDKLNLSQMLNDENPSPMSGCLIKLFISTY